MTEDPTLFTSFEWVLAALASCISLVLYPLTRNANKGSPFAKRDEEWLGDALASNEPERTGTKNEISRADSPIDTPP